MTSRIVTLPSVRGAQYPSYTCASTACAPVLSCSSMRLNHCSLDLIVRLTGVGIGVRLLLRFLSACSSRSSPWATESSVSKGICCPMPWATNTATVFGAAWGRPTPTEYLASMTLPRENVADNGPCPHRQPERGLFLTIVHSSGPL